MISTFHIVINERERNTVKSINCYLKTLETNDQSTDFYFFTTTRSLTPTQPSQLSLDPKILDAASPSVSDWLYDSELTLLYLLFIILLTNDDENSCH